MLLDRHEKWGSPPRAQRPTSPRVSVVVPTHNEAANLPAVFELLPEDVFEVLVVDGHSTDGTPEVAKQLRPDARIVTQTRRGKGNAIACGFNNAHGDVLVMLDADGSADPREIPKFLEVLLDGADYAKGTRFTAGGGSSDITALRRAGNTFLNLAANTMYRTRYTDLCYGYNALWRDALPVLGLDCGEQALDMRWGDGFEIETILNVRVAKAGLRIVEVPSFEQPRLHGESKLNAVRDGFRVLGTLFTEKRLPPPYASAPSAGPGETPAHVLDVRDADAIPLGQSETAHPSGVPSVADVAAEVEGTEGRVA